MTDKILDSASEEQADDDPLIHVVYASKATELFTSGEVEPLLEKTRLANQKVNITGMLLFCEGTFFQVLEGDPDVLEKLYSKIEADPRHDQVTKIISESIAGRAFPDWTMGYVDATSEQLNELSGLNDFFNRRTCLLDVDAGRAKKLLKAFSDGRWRLS